MNMEKILFWGIYTILLIGACIALCFVKNPEVLRYISIATGSFGLGVVTSAAIYAKYQKGNQDKIEGELEDIKEDEE